MNRSDLALLIQIVILVVVLLILFGVGVTPGPTW